MNRALVTGAGGFIGSAVVRRLLARGCQVRCLIEPGAGVDNLAGLDVERVTGNVCDRGHVEAALAGCDTLFHLAAIYAVWHPDPSQIYRVNLEGSRTVLWAAYRAQLARVVYTSSIAAVGRPAGDAIANEETAFAAADFDDGNDYIRSKWLSEREALGFADAGLPLVVVNPAFPFGERDRGPTPTGRFIVDALTGKLPAYFAGGFCAVDVDDVAEAHVRAAERGRVGERYILGAHNVTYRAFFHQVCERARVPPPRLEFPRWAAIAAGWAAERWADRVTHQAPISTAQTARYASTHLYFDGGKAMRELGMEWAPLETTIEKAIHWFRREGYA
jgi:dihydroflavonol-4-reductase